MRGKLVLLTIGMILVLMSFLLFTGKETESTTSIDFSKYTIEVNDMTDNTDEVLGVDYGDVRPGIGDLECIEERYKTYDEIPLDADLQIHIQRICERYNTDYALVLAVIEQECGFVPEFEGEHVGLMQVSTKWFADLADSMELALTDVVDSAELGICYLSQLLIKYDGEPALALMVYNQGQSAEEQYERGDTSRYALSVMDKQRKWQKVLGE